MKPELTIGMLALLIGIPAFAADKAATFDGSKEDVFSAAEVAAQRSWVLSYTNRPSGLLSFVTGRSFASQGMECAVTLRELSPGKVEIVMHTQKKGSQKFAFGAGDRIAKKFFEGIRVELSEPTAKGARAETIQSRLR